jgi:hypothetical protein
MGLGPHLWAAFGRSRSIVDARRPLGCHRSLLALLMPGAAVTRSSVSRSRSTTSSRPSCVASRYRSTFGSIGCTWSCRRQSAAPTRTCGRSESATSAGGHRRAAGAWAVISRLLVEPCGGHSRTAPSAQHRTGKVTSVSGVPDLFTRSVVYVTADAMSSSPPLEGLPAFGRAAREG